MGDGMSEWAAKRFWSEATVEQAEGGWQVRLDARLLRTPAKRALLLPSEALARAIAAEWQAQEERIDPLSMPSTRAANAAIDKVAPQHAEVAAVIAAYGETDLLCHRADAPAELVARQSEAWDPMLDWAAEDLHARLVPVTGVMPARQDPAALERLHALTAAHGPFKLTALHDLVSLSGSLILGFAAIRGRKTPEALWQMSRIDEDWQVEHWGVDAEAAEQAERRRAAFLHASLFFQMVRS